MRSQNAAPASLPCPRFSASRRFGDPMPNYRYRALNGNGELVSGAITATAPGDVAQRIERLDLVLVDNVTLEEGGGAGRSFVGIFNKPKPEDVTLFTRDLALLLRAGARINDGLELLAADPDFGRLRAVVLSHIRTAAICRRAAGFRRQGRSRYSDLPEFLDLPARQFRPGIGAA